MDIKDIAYDEVMGVEDEGVYVVDTTRKIQLWNREAERITGFSSSEVIGHSCSEDILVHVDEDGVYMCANGCPLADTMKNGRELTIPAYLHHRDGHRMPVSITASPLMSPEGHVIGAIERFVVATVSRVATATRVENESVSSTAQEAPQEKVQKAPASTGILDQDALNEGIARNLDELRNRDESFGIIMAEIINFDTFTERHGEQAAKNYVNIVSNTLKHNNDPGDMLGLWREDIFLLILDISNQDRLENLTKKLRMLVATSFSDIDGEKMSVNISTGATLARADDSIESLTGRAVNIIRMNKMMGISYDTSRELNTESGTENDSVKEEAKNKVHTDSLVKEKKEVKKKVRKAPKASKTKKARSMFSAKPGSLFDIRPGTYGLIAIMIFIWMFIYWMWETFYRYN